MESLSKLLIYIPGILIFLVGSRETAAWLKSFLFGKRISAKVSCVNHVRKKYKAGRNQYNYYNAVLEYKVPNSSRLLKTEMKVPFEPAVGQVIKLSVDREGKNAVFSKNPNTSNIHPAAMTVIGALMLITALEANNGNEVAAAFCIGGMLAAAGISAAVHNIRLKNKKLTAVTGTIVDVFERQISKESKLIKEAKVTHYPIVSFTFDQQEIVFRPEVNSEKETDFKTGDDFLLYYDSKDNEIYEKPAKAAWIAAGILLLILGIVIIASAASAMI